MEFTLGSSQYATMALREMTKDETSAGFQTVMSQAVKAENLKAEAEKAENGSTANDDGSQQECELPHKSIEMS